MRKLNLKNLWVAIKRNPVLNAFIGAVIVQFLSDLKTDQVDWAHITGYVAMLLFGVAARMFTTPSKEHKESVENLHSAIDQLRRGEKI